MLKGKSFFLRNKVLFYIVLTFIGVIVAILLAFLLYLKDKKTEISQGRLEEEITFLREEIEKKNSVQSGVPVEGNASLGLQPTDSPNSIKSQLNGLPIDTTSNATQFSDGRSGYPSGNQMSGMAGEAANGNSPAPSPNPNAPQPQGSASSEEKKKIEDTEVLNPDKWKTYTNSKYSYSFKYPQEFNLGECSSDASLCKLGKIVETEGGNTVDLTSTFDGQTWPKITVTHLDSAEYQLPEEKKLIDWVKEKFPSTASVMPKNYNIEIKTKSGSPEKGLKIKIEEGGAENYRYEVYVEKSGKIYKMNLQGINGQKAKDFYDDWLDEVKL